MRKISMLFSILVVVAMLLTACGGAETTTSVPPVTQDTTSTSEPSMTEAGVATSATMDTTTTPGVPVTGGQESPARVSNQLNFAVVDQNGEQISKVEDMVLDFDNQMISYVIVGTGGSMKLGEKTLFVPWDMLQLPDAASVSATGQANAFVFQGDQEMLKNAASMDATSMLPERGQSASDWDADIRNFWQNGSVGGAMGTQSATEATNGTAVPNMTATTTTSGLATSTATTGGNNGNTGGNSGKNGSDQGAALQGVMLASEVIGSTITVNQQGEGQGQGAGVATATLEVGAATPEDMATATTGTGMNGTGDTVSAMIEDVITDPQTGDIQYLVLSGTFDDGERWIPVPLKFFKWDAGTQALSLPMNGMALQNAPVFENGKFPDMSMSGWDIDFSDFWNNGGTGTGGTGALPTATP